jgi:hypothetical protein
MAPKIPANATMEDKVDLVLQLLVEQSELLTKSQLRIEQLEKENLALKSSVTSLNKEIYNIKNSSNRRDQNLLNNSIRIFGISVSEDEPNSTDGGKALSLKVFERVLKPVLLAAKVKCSVSTTIEDCYRVGKPTADKTRPPPVVVKLCSPTLRLTILRNKKTGLAPPPEADQRIGIKKFTIVEDLTSDAFKLLKGLAGDSRVAKAWTIDGNIRFTLANDSTGSVKKAKSVYDSIDHVIESASK